MSLSYVNSTDGFGTGNSPSITITGVAAGDLLVVYLSFLAGASIAAAPTGNGNTYNARYNFTQSGNVTIYCYDVLSAASGSTTISATLSGNTGQIWEFVVYEFKTTTGSWAFDTKSTNTGTTGTTATSNSMTNAQAAEVLVGYGVPSSGSMTTGEAGWTFVETANGDGREYIILSSTGSNAATFGGFTSGPWMACVAGWNASGGISVSGSILVTGSVNPTIPSSIGYVQSNIAGTGSSASSTTCTYTGAQTAGHQNIVAVMVANTTALTPTITDTKGNSYGSAIASNTLNIAQAIQVYLFICSSIAAATANSNIVTATVGSASSFGITIIALEYSGVSSNTDGTTQTSSGSSTSYSTPALVTSNISDLVLAIVGGGGSGTAATAGSGYIVRQSWTFSPWLAVEDQITSATGSFTGPMTGPSQQYAEISIALKATPPGSVSPVVAGNVLVTGSVSPAYSPLNVVQLGNVSVIAAQPNIQVGYQPAVSSGSVLVTGSTAPILSPISIANTGLILVTGAVNPALTGGTPKSGIGGSLIAVYNFWGGGF